MVLIIRDNQGNNVIVLTPAQCFPGVCIRTVLPEVPFIDPGGVENLEGEHKSDKTHMHYLSTYVMLLVKSIQSQCGQLTDCES